LPGNWPIIEVSEITTGCRPGGHSRLSTTPSPRPARAFKTRKPAFGLPAIWVTQDKSDRAIAAGYIVVDPPTAISTHLSEIIRIFLPDPLTRR